MCPKCILVMLVNGMSQLMHDDIVAEFWWEAHKLDIETDII
jgi:hypothetical protein